MNKAVFEKIRKIVYDQSGITIQPGKESMVQARLGRRLRSLSLTSEEDYLRYLEREMEKEIVELLDVISTNVTYFFREEEHFHHLQKAMEGWLDEGQRRFRIWSAASSTGEEPHSIAMVIREVLRKKKIASSDIRILATDISTRVLAKASAGIFDEERMESVPKELADRYFDRINQDGKAVYQAKAVIRDMLHVRRLNLSKPPFPMRGPMDVVFCRNVMIYFDNDTRQGLTDEFDRLLKPSGYAIIGKSETLVQRKVVMDRVGPSIYQRKA